MKNHRLPRPRSESSVDGSLTRLGARKTITGPTTAWQGLASVGALGFTLVGATFLGLFAGYYLDRWLQTSPWFTILLLLVGIVAGFMNIFFSTSRSCSPHHPKKNDSPFNPD